MRPDLYDDLEECFSEQTKNTIDYSTHSGKSSEKYFDVYALDEELQVSKQQTEKRGEADKKEEEQLLHRLSPKVKALYVKKVIQETTKAQKEAELQQNALFRLAQYEAVQRLVAGEEPLKWKIPRTTKSRISRRPPKTRIIEKEAVHQVFLITKQQEKLFKKGEKPTGFPTGSFKNFYEAYKKYKSRLKNSDVTFLSP